MAYTVSFTSVMEGRAGCSEEVSSISLASLPSEVSATSSPVPSSLSALSPSSSALSVPSSVSPVFVSSVSSVVSSVSSGVSVSSVGVFISSVPSCSSVDSSPVLSDMPVPGVPSSALELPSPVIIRPMSTIMAMISSASRAQTAAITGVVVLG